MTSSGRKRIRCAILTVNDLCATGQLEDGISPKIRRLLSEYRGADIAVTASGIVGNNSRDIESQLKTWSDGSAIDFIVTIGGTGLKADDVTPDATRAVIDKEVNGVVISIVAVCVAAGLPYGTTTRLLCGKRGETFILNLPGSIQGAEACLKQVLAPLARELAATR